MLRLGGGDFHVPVDVGGKEVVVDGLGVRGCCEGSFVGAGVLVLHRDFVEKMFLFQTKHDGSHTHVRCDVRRDGYSSARRCLRVEYVALDLLDRRSRLPHFFVLTEILLAFDDEVFERGNSVSHPIVGVFRPVEELLSREQIVVVLFHVFPNALLIGTMEWLEYTIPVEPGSYESPVVCEVEGATWVRQVNARRGGGLKRFRGRRERVAPD